MSPSNGGCSRETLGDIDTFSPKQLVCVLSIVYKLTTYTRLFLPLAPCQKQKHPIPMKPLANELLSRVENVLITGTSFCRPHHVNRQPRGICSRQLLSLLLLLRNSASRFVPFFNNKTTQDLFRTKISLCLTLSTFDSHKIPFDKSQRS
jgi:hypothetical protein